MHNHVVWFDIPAADLDRAMRFYRSVLGTAIDCPSAEVRIAIFDHSSELPVGGCIFEDPAHVPSEGGVLVYFDVDGRLDDAVIQVIANGGSVLQPQHSIGYHGYRAVVKDSEGNRIALHSHTI